MKKLGYFLLLLASSLPSARALENERVVTVVDSTGAVLDLNEPLKIGTTIGFRVHPQHPDTIASIRLQSWNQSVVGTEGITNNFDEAGDFYLPYVVPSFAASNPLALDVLVQTKMGGRTHFFFSKPHGWKIAKGSFLESEVDQTERLFVKGLTVDTVGPKISEIKVTRERLGANFQFSVEDDLLNPQTVKVAGLAADCVPDLKNPALYRCFRMVEWENLAKEKREVEISAYDKANNYEFKTFKNTFTSKDVVGLVGNPTLKRCNNVNFEVDFRVTDSVGLDDVRIEEFPAKTGASLQKKDLQIDGRVHLVVLRHPSKLPPNYSLKLTLVGNNGTESSFVIPTSELSAPLKRKKGRVDSCKKVDIKIAHPSANKSQG